jgi:hypothetical protein
MCDAMCVVCGETNLWNSWCYCNEVKISNVFACESCFFHLMKIHRGLLDHGEECFFGPSRCFVCRGGLD